MANSINWGKIYNYTWCGIGVAYNTIFWGKSYSDKSELSIIIQGFASRVESDGGILESIGCINI